LRYIILILILFILNCAGQNSYTNLANSPYDLNSDNNASTNAVNLQSAVDNATAGDVLYLPAGRYNIDTTIWVNKDINIFGDGEGKTVIDADSTVYINGGNPGRTFYFYGSEEEAAILAENTIPGRRYFIVDDASDFNGGDLFFVKDTSLSAPGQMSTSTGWYFRTSGTEHRGEQHIVDKVVSDTIFITGKIWDTYNINRGTIILRRIDPITFHLKDLTIRYGEDDTLSKAVTAAYHINSKIENVTVDRVGYMAFDITQGVNFKLLNCTTKDQNTYGAGYGLGLASVSGVIIAGNTFINYRSAIDVYGSTNWGATRNVNIYGNLFKSGGHKRGGSAPVDGTGLMQGTALSSHWGSEFIHFHGNTIIGGKQVAKTRGGSYNISNNYVTGNLVQFISILGGGGNMRINNNVYDPVTVGRENLSVTADPYDDFTPTNGFYASNSMDYFIRIDGWYTGARDTSLFLEVKNNRVNGIKYHFFYTYDESLDNIDVSYNDILFIGDVSSGHYGFMASAEVEFSNSSLMGNTFYKAHQGSFTHKHNLISLNNTPYEYLYKNIGVRYYGGISKFGFSGISLEEIKESIVGDSLDIITTTDTLRIPFRKITK
jgi:hypothetical protein